MNVLLAHGNVEWAVGGVVVFIGIMVFLFHVVKGHLLHIVLGGAVWVLVYSLHAGTIAGTMTATLSALLFDLFGIPMLKLFMKE
jgi:hypothetical protein